jgi:peptide/nickel transport system permease protein
MTTPPDPLDLQAAGQLPATETESPVAEVLGTGLDVPGAKKRSHGQFQDIWRRYRRNRLALFGLMLVVIFVVLAIAAPYITPYDPYDQNLYNTLQPPDSEHWFGTDTRGRDLFTLVIYGLRLALLVGLTTVVGSLLVGLALGAMAGYRRGTSDALIMRTTDIFLAFPLLIGAILVVRMMGEGVWPVIIALVVFGWPTTARLMRGQVLALRESEYVEAARSIGASDTRIVLRHILPNAVAPVFIYAFTSIGVAVVAMASLAYLGVGVPADEPEWGRLINQGVEQVQVEGKDYLWMFPAAAISLFTLAFAFVADGLRDALDPKLR